MTADVHKPYICPTGYLSPKIYLIFNDNLLNLKNYENDVSLSATFLPVLSDQGKFHSVFKDPISYPFQTFIFHPAL